MKILLVKKEKKQNKTYSDNEKHANENIKKKNTNENGTYEYSSNISTSTKTMIPVLEMWVERQQKHKWSEKGTEDLIRKDKWYD